MADTHNNIRIISGTKRGTPSDENLVFRQATILFGAGAIGIGVLGLADLAFNVTIFSSIFPGYQTIAFSTAILCILFGTILATNAIRPFPGKVRIFIQIIVAAIAVVEALELPLNIMGSHFIVETILIRIGNSLPGPLTSAISPGTLFLIILLAIGFFMLFGIPGNSKLQQRDHDVVSIVGLTVALTSFTIFLSYAYRAPFLYGTNLIPLAAPTAIALTFIGAGLVMSAGPESFPVRYFIGNTISARLLRSILPLTFVIIFAESIISHQIYNLTETSETILVSASIVIFALLAGYIVFRASRGLGSALEHEEQERKRAESALQVNMEKYRRFFMTSMDCVFITSKDGHWIDMNNAAVELFGYESREELMQVKISDLYANQEDRKKHTGSIEKDGFTKEYPVDLRKKDGTILHTLITSVPSYDDEGNITGFQGTIRDITERRQAEQQIAESSRFIAALMDTLPVPIFYKDISGKYLGCNPPFDEYVGIPRSDLIGKTAYDISPPDLADRYTAADRELFDKPVPQRYEAQVRFANGSRHDVIFYKAPFFNADGSVAGLIGTFLDITDRKLSEEALRQSQFLLEDAMDQGRMAYWELDVLTGTFTFNDRFYALYGTTAEREGGYRMKAEVYAREFVHPDEAGLVATEIEKSALTSDPDFFSEVEHRIVRRDGEVRNIVVRYRVTKDKNGRTIKTHGVNQDITERKLAEEALQQVNKKLNLLSSITRHDINNQLFSLKAFLDLSKEVVGDSARMSEYILKEERAVDTIEHQIAFTKEYQDLGVKAPVWQNVETCTKKALDGLPVRDIQVTAEVNGLEVFADPLFERVFYNLIDNALKYGGQKMTMIRITSQESEKGLAIFVEDDGVGISAEDKKHLFERGFGHHTGLGLFLSSEILSITNIRITETGEPGNGARFEIVVPKGVYRSLPF